MSGTAMFPLGSVLFPHMPLSLRLFEPRYLQMLDSLLDEPAPGFGVVLIERGHEVGGGDQRFPVGTMARVVRVESGPDAMGVMAVGTGRIRVERWLADDPWPQAQVEPLPELNWDESLDALRADTEQQVRRALAVSPDAVWPEDIDLADHPVAACWQLAGITPVGPLDQMALLQADTLLDLLTTTGRLAGEATELAGW